MSKDENRTELTSESARSPKFRRFPRSDADVTVLVVDDSDVDRKILSAQIASIGIADLILEVADGESALRTMREQPISLVFTDWNNPGLSGEELCRHVSNDSELGRPYVIVTTSSDPTEVLLSALELGADDFLKKPVDDAELRGRLRAGVRLWLFRKVLMERNSRIEEALGRERVLREALEEDRRQASQLQQRLLPPSSSTEGNCRFATMYKPAAGMAGDMLGYFRIGDQNVGFFVLDVCGHGAAAALRAVSVSTDLRPRPGRGCASVWWDRKSEIHSPQTPNHVLETLNDNYVDPDETGAYFTMVYGYIDQRTGVCQIARGGHPEPIIIRSNGETSLVESGGPPVGLMDGVEFDTQEIQLEPGDRLFIWSDGLNEAANDLDEEFGVERVLEIAKAKHDGPDSIIRGIEEAVQEWMGDVELDDDVSALVLEYNPQSKAHPLP